MFVEPKDLNIKWLRDGKAVDKDPRLQKFDSILRVSNVNTEDTGVYQCFATVDGGLQMQSSGELRLGGIVYSMMLRLLLKSQTPISCFQIPFPACPTHS
jgi:hypothetical protein